MSTVSPAVVPGLGNEIGAGLPVLSSITVSDFRKSSILSGGTLSWRLSPWIVAERSKYATPFR
jgi:hypothetical protein